MNQFESLNWKVPNFYKMLTGTKTRKFQFVGNRPVTGRFTIIMRLFGHNNDMIQIYYMSSNTVSIKYELRCSQGLMPKKIGGKFESHIIQGGRSQYIATISGRELCPHSSELCLTFLYQINNLDTKASLNKSVFEPMNDTLKRLLHNGQFSKIIIIKSADGKVHKVHKDLISVRSPVFKAQFEHNTIESKTKTIETHLENEVLAEVLTFIYSNKASMVNDMPMKLLAAADFYQISELKQLCEKALHETLSVENAIGILLLADLYSAETLKGLTLEFIRCEPNIVVKEEVWQKFQSVELLKALCKCILDTDVVYFNSCINN